MRPYPPLLDWIMWLFIAWFIGWMCWVGSIRGWFLKRKLAKLRVREREPDLPSSRSRADPSRR